MKDTEYNTDVESTTLANKQKECLLHPSLPCSDINRRYSMWTDQVVCNGCCPAGISADKCLSQLDKQDLLSGILKAIVLSRGLSK
jgi:hypothetical protein